MAKTKASKTDFQPSMLPQTRKQVFWDVLKMHWKKFISYGFLMLLFTLPFHLLAINDDFYQASLLQSSATMTAEEYRTALLQYLSMNNTRAVLNIASFLILAVGTSGMIRIIRQYSWMENVYFGGDFSKGIKQNCKQTMLLALLVGVVNALCVYAGNLATVTQNQGMAIVLVIPIGLAVLVGIPAVSYALVSISIYQHTFWGHVKLGLMIMGKSPLKTLLALLCCLGPFALLLIPSIYAHVIGRLVLSLLIPIVMLGWYLFCLNQFDKFVNSVKFPHLVNKGIISQPQSEE